MDGDHENTGTWTATDGEVIGLCAKCCGPAHEGPCEGKRRTTLSPFRVFLLVLGGFFFFMFVVVPVSRISSGRTAAYELSCKNNLMDMSTAIFQYEDDHKGRTPGTLSELVPRWLKSVPTCPATGTVTYAYEHGSRIVRTTPTGQEEIFTLYCAGANHSRLPPNYPQYSADAGLISTP